MPARQTDGERWFCVQHNGAGFDMAQAGRRFVAFARLHRRDEISGRGIGLATLQRIIQHHGGWLTVQGVPRQGACFSPLALPPPASTNTQTP